MRSVTHEVWPITEQVSGYNRGRQAHELGQGKRRHKQTQANKLMSPYKATPPRSPLCHCFTPPVFIVSPFTPIWCVWTWLLAANALPWTPSAVWLSTVSWAWLLLSGRARPVLSPVPHAAFCQPASSFTEGCTHRQRGRDKKVICQALAHCLFDFQPLTSYSRLGAPSRDTFVYASIFLAPWGKEAKHILFVSDERWSNCWINLDRLFI